MVCAKNMANMLTSSRKPNHCFLAVIVVSSVLKALKPSDPALNSTLLKYLSDLGRVWPVAERYCQKTKGEPEPAAGLLCCVRTQLCSCVSVRVCQCVRLCLCGCVFPSVPVCRYLYPLVFKRLNMPLAMCVCVCVLNLKVCVVTPVSRLQASPCRMVMTALRLHCLTPLWSVWTPQRCRDSHEKRPQR